jgi:hypothetical protein
VSEPLVSLPLAGSGNMAVMQYTVTEVDPDNPEAGNRLVATVQGADCSPRVGERLVLLEGSDPVEYVVLKVEHQAKLRAERDTNAVSVGSGPLVYVERFRRPPGEPLVATSS